MFPNGVRGRIFLKSFLARRGFDKTDLKSIGHNLRKARDEAVEHGFAFHDMRQFDTLVDSLSDARNKLSLRYIVPGSKLTVPEPIQACLALLDGLDAEIRKKVDVKSFQ